MQVDLTSSPDLEIPLDLPNLPTQGVGCSHQGPGEEGDLLAQLAAVNLDPAELFHQGFQGVLTSPDEDMAVRVIDGGHILGQEVELHLQEKNTRVSRYYEAVHSKLPMGL